MTAFDFSSAGKIVFGGGRLAEIGELCRPFGQRALVVHGSRAERARPLIDRLEAAGIERASYSVEAEPSISGIERGIARLRENHCDFVIGIGGGSALDAAKAIAALAANPGEPLDYLEVIGAGRPLENKPLPCVAIPTTAGTGSEATRNAVLACPRRRVKVSLRHPSMLPRVALVDPELTESMPPNVTAATGLDALTQLIEPYVSRRAQPMTDVLCLEGLRLVARSLRTAYDSGAKQAREDMALASLFGGLALANAGLGAVHGFAGPIGGRYNAPHGAVCAALLPHAVIVNLRALRAEAAQHPALGRFAQIARILTGDESATIEDGVAWILNLCAYFQIPSLRSYGIDRSDVSPLVDGAARASSMRGNPVELGHEDLEEILMLAL